MNIALIAHSFTKNMKEAANITTLNFAKALQERGHFVRIIAGGRKGFPHHELFEGINVYRNTISSSSHFFGHVFNNTYGIMKTLRRCKHQGWEPDIIHCFFAALPLSLNGILARKLLFPQSKVVCTLKSESNHHFGRKGLWLLKHARFVTIPTILQQEMLIARGISPYKIKIIRSHINCQKFQRRNKENLKEQYRYAGKKVLLHYGAFRRDKGTIDFLHSIPTIVQEKQDIHCILICRWKNLDPIYRQFIDKHNLTNDVTIITDDVIIEDYVAMADCAVFPYQSLRRTETNPSCVLECMSAGTPVITTSLPELNEIFEDGKDCIMVPACNPHEIANAVTCLLENPKIKESIIDYAHEKVKAYDIDTITTSFEKLYLEIQHE